MFDQTEPTLLMKKVWSAIDLVPSWTRKMKPKASSKQAGEPEHETDHGVAVLRVEKKTSPIYRLLRWLVWFNYSRFGQPVAVDRYLPSPGGRRVHGFP